MHEVLSRIKVFEEKILQALGKINSLKEENKKLIDQNNRLKENIQQLKKKLEENMPGISGAESVEPVNYYKHHISIEQIRQEIDMCLVEIEECLAKLSD